METRVERDEDAKHEPVANKPPLSPDLKILESQVLRGPNYWSYEPAIRLLVDLGSLEHWPSNTLPKFTDVLIGLLPGLHDHGCSLHRPGGFIERLRDGTWMGHVAEHVALELQREAGGSTTRGKTRRAGTPGQYNVVYGYSEEQVGLAAGKLAVRLLNHLVQANPTFDFVAELESLVLLADRSLRTIDPGHPRRGRSPRHPLHPAQRPILRPTGPGEVSAADPGHDDVADVRARR